VIEGEEKMLKNIPACISPDLMHALVSMGHGDDVNRAECTGI